MHPEVKPEMTEEEIVYAVCDALPEEIEGDHFLVQGMSNVTYYAATVIVKNRGRAYYVLTKKKRDENGRFVFVPVELREYADLNKLLGW